MPKSLRIVLMGTGPFAVPTFDAIDADRDQISLVVSRPSPISTAKQQRPSMPVLDWAHTHGLPTFQPESINTPDAIHRIEAEQADLLVVCDYGQILSRETLAKSRLGGINLHGSLLPRHRGAAPVQWAILRGDKTSGISVIHMTPRLDGGPILATRELTINEHETAAQLEPRLSELGVAATLDAIDLLRNCMTLDETEPLGKEQDARLATKAPRLTRQDGQLDFRYPVTVVDRQIRGLQPWPGAYGTVILDGGKQQRIIIGEARPLNNHYRSDRFPIGSILSGEALSDYGSATLAVVCNPGLLEIRSIQPSGKRGMLPDAFLRGYGRSRSLSFETLQSEHALLSQLQP